MPWVRHQPVWGSFDYRRKNSSREKLGTTTLISLPKSKFHAVDGNRGMRLNVVAVQRTSPSRTAGARHPKSSAAKQHFRWKYKHVSHKTKPYPPQKRNSRHITSNEQLKICLCVGGCVVGTALVESGFGRETPFSVERGLPPKVFFSTNPILTRKRSKNQYRSK